MGKTIRENKKEEIIEKKSKFIANLQYVSSVEEAEETLKEIKKQYRDARHNCFAYRVLENGQIIERMSDDGEPSGTAGGPILNILAKKGLINIIVVVTRYFGGILLGTGGLVKAYSEATQKVLDVATYVIEEPGYVIEIELDYAELEKCKYFCKKQELKIIHIEYEQKVKIDLEVTFLQKEDLWKQFLEKDSLQFKVDNFQVKTEKMIRR